MTDIDDIKRERCPRCSELLRHEDGQEYCIGFGCEYRRDLHEHLALHRTTFD